MVPNEQENPSSVPQDAVSSDAGSASRDREREQPHWLLKLISAVLAPIGVPWAKEIQEKAERLKREAEEAARQAGRKKVDDVYPRS